MAQRLASSNSPTRYASVASYSASIAEYWNLAALNYPQPRPISSAIDSMILLKGALDMRSLVLFWYLLISLMATVPGLYRLYILLSELVLIFFFLIDLLNLEPVATLLLDKEALSLLLPAILTLGIPIRKVNYENTYV